MCFFFNIWIPECDKPAKTEEICNKNIFELNCNKEKKYWDEGKKENKSKHQGG